MPVEFGTQLGSYRIESQLGEGGMGTVYRAFDTKLNRPVAIKFLSDHLADAAARRRFQLPINSENQSRQRGGLRARRSVKRHRGPTPWTAATDSTPESDRRRHEEWVSQRAAMAVPDHFDQQARREADRVKAQEQEWRSRLDREIRIVELPQARLQAQGQGRNGHVAAMVRVIGHSSRARS